MQNVKNTMLDGLLSWLAPHPCISCGVIGALLCNECKKYIVSHKPAHCLWCERRSGVGLCATHSGTIDAFYWLGDRTGALQRLVDGPKLFAQREAVWVAGEMLVAALPFPPGAVLVPLPTSRRHVRMRGFDHTESLTYELARRTRLKKRAVLARTRHFVQKGASRQQRVAQVRGGYSVAHALDPSVTYILVDDIVTTGASVYEAARCVREAGAETVWAVCIARQKFSTKLAQSVKIA